jgi:FkbM family methyltransferase
MVRVSPFALTKNEYYDRLTSKIIKTYCSPTDVCIDVGAHDGKILQLITKHCNRSTHYAFEPLPFFYKLLVRKFGSACHVYEIALGKEKMVQPFNYVRTSPAYSGLRKRAYDCTKEDEQIVVRTDLLDNYIPASEKVKLIKIDVEGGELDVLLGAEQTISQSQPLILFEYGKGGAEAYNVTPATMFDFFAKRHYSIYLLQLFLKQKISLSLEQFITNYNSNREYFFVASPK